MKDDLKRIVNGLKRNEPELREPEKLTEDIMLAIQQEEQERSSLYPMKSNRLPRLILFQRLLTAASVCLFLMFGVEQYMVVDKVNQLEQQNRSVTYFSYAQFTSRIVRSGIPISELQKRFPLHKKLLSATTGLNLSKLHVNFQYDKK